jgi:K+-sensing histidine kinase KdpD
MKNSLVSVLSAYALVLVIMAAGTWAGLKLASIEVEDADFILALAAALGCLFGRFGPALFAGALASLSDWYFFTPPIWSFALPSHPHDLSLLLFVAVTASITGLVLWQKLKTINALKAEEDFFLTLMRGPRA